MQGLPGHRRRSRDGQAALIHGRIRVAPPGWAKTAARDRGEPWPIVSGSAGRRPDIEQDVSVRVSGSCRPSRGSPAPSYDAPRTRGCICRCPRTSPSTRATAPVASVAGLWRAARGVSDDLTSDRTAGPRFQRSRSSRRSNSAGRARHPKERLEEMSGVLLRHRTPSPGRACASGRWGTHGTPAGRGDPGRGHRGRRMPRRPRHASARRTW